ncbi:MAG: RNA methyltransferase [Chitinophagaceae bacterium]
MLGKLKIKYIQSLGQKKLRDEEGLFIAEGPKILQELLTSAKKNIVAVYGIEEWIQANEATIGNIETVIVTDDELAKISQLSTPNKALAIIKKFDNSATPDLKGKVSLALDTIQDPGNLGTIIRIADWFGVTNIICSTDCADIYNSKVVQATMGSIARVNVQYVDLAAWLASKKDIRIYATALEGQDVATMKKLEEGIIVFGNESKGISEEVLQLVNVKITIPKKGNAESLNAAVAAGIVLAVLS